MQTTTLSSVIDKAITLKEGGVIAIPCSSYKDMESVRTKLYKLRNQLAKKHSSLARTIDITRKVKTDSWTIYVSKEKTLLGVLIIEDGKAKPFMLEDDEERREKLIEEEEEEKVEDENKTEKQATEKDFDEVAAGIEASQNLKEKLIE